MMEPGRADDQALHEAVTHPALAVTEELATKAGEPGRSVFERADDLVPLSEREPQEPGFAVVRRLKSLGSVTEAGLPKLPGERKHVRVTNLKAGEHHASERTRTRVRPQGPAGGSTPTEEQ